MADPKKPTPMSTHELRPTIKIAIASAIQTLGQMVSTSEETAKAKINMAPCFATFRATLCAPVGTSKFRRFYTTATRTPSITPTRPAPPRRGTNAPTPAGATLGPATSLTAQIGVVAAEVGATVAEAAAEATIMAVAVAAEVGAAAAETMAVAAEVGAAEAETMAVAAEVGAAEAEIMAVAAEVGAAEATTRSLLLVATH